MIVKFSKFRVGQKVYLYYGGCCMVTILENHLIDGEWHYSIDCAIYKEGMILDNVPQDYLGPSPAATSKNRQLTPGYMRELASQVDE